MKFYCIADKDSSLGFKFSGMETREVETKLQAHEALRVALSAEGIGIIVITEKAASLIREEVDEITFSQDLPLIIEIPSRGSTKATKSVADSLRHVIGVGI
ncbi:MAG: V-type ATP synthase subunit F [Candidatus Omnitrophota bacterium]|jgi:V/A-type H+-transporting ATPase subunit F